MKLTHYQTAAKDTAIYPPDQALNYLVPALAAEAGELAGKWAKIIRDQGGAYDETNVEEMASELGDCLWMVAVIAHELGWPLDMVASANLVKLADRKKRGKLSGSGDNR